MDRRAPFFQLFAVAAIAQAGGCAVEPRLSATNDQVVSSRAAIAAAEAAQAQRFAPEDLTRARRKLDLIPSYVAGHQYQYAQWLGEQAQVDAEVARVKALVEQRRHERSL